MASERAVTAWLREFFGSDRRRVPVGIGDDGAVVRNRGSHSVVACDPVVEGVHFDVGAPAKLVGRKAVNRNLADLAAMGARPDFLLVSVLIPPDTHARRRRSLFEGIRSAAAEAGCTVVGGDLAATPGPLVVTVTAIGYLVESRALERRGARAGDQIHVTGPLGGSRLGHHLRFRPPLDEGAWLVAQPPVSAAIDVSDGLLLDLATLLAASGGLGAELAEDRIPISAAARRLARSTGRTALDHALRDGEDHVLLFTVRRAAELPRRGPLSAHAFEPIGVVTRDKGLRLRAPSGAVRAVAPRGFEHDL